MIKRSLDWTELRPLSPARGALSRQIECLRLIAQALHKEEVPILQTVYSPLLQAAQLAGRQKVLRDMRVRPDRLRSGLNQLTENTLRFLEALNKQRGLSGIFLVTGFASHDILSEAEFGAFAMPHLSNILSALPAHWWLNIAQAAGPSPMLKLLSALPVQAFNWDTRARSVSHSQSDSLYSGAACGGLRDDEDLLRGTPALLRSVIRDALAQTEGRRLILSGSGDGYVTMPISNIRAVRSLAEGPA